VQLVALFLDAMFLPVRPDGSRRGCSSHEDWQELGRDLIARGFGAPLLVVADGAPGLIKAGEQCWPASDRQHCAVHYADARVMPNRVGKPLQIAGSRVAVSA
jgi:mutator family transposase